MSTFQRPVAEVEMVSGFRVLERETLSALGPEYLLADKHLRDVRAMLEISGDEIDVDRIERGVNALNLLEVWTAVSQHE